MENEIPLEKHIFKQVAWITQHYGPEEAGKLLPLLHTTFHRIEKAIRYIENNEYEKALSLLDELLEANRHPYLFINTFVVQAGIHGRDALLAAGRGAECLLWVLYTLSVIETQDPELRYADDLAEVHLLLIEEMKMLPARDADPELILQKAWDMAKSAYDRKDIFAAAMMELTLSHVLVSVGNFGEARRRMESAQSKLDVDRHSLVWAFRCCVLAEIEANTSRFSEAKVAVEQAEEIFRKRGRMVYAFRVAKEMGTLFFSRSAWSEAGSLLGRAVKSANQVYRACLLNVKRAEWLIDVGNTYRHAGYALSRCHHLSEALAVLEQGRARALSDALARDRADLEQVRKLDPEGYALYSEAADELRELDKPSSSDCDVDLRERVRYAWAKFEKAIARIRQLQGYEQFLEEPSYDDVRRAVQCGSPIVYIVPSTAGSLAMIVRTQPGTNQVIAKSLWLDELTNDDLTRLMVGSDASDISDASKNSWFGAYNQWRKNTEDSKCFHNWCQTIEDTTKILWKRLMGPIIECLRSMNIYRVVLVPGGLLALLPLHAAWTMENGLRHYALDDVVFTYVPSARMQILAFHIAMKCENAHQTSFLAIDEPLPVNAPRLKFATPEVDLVASYFSQEERNLLRKEKAKRSTIITALPNTDIIHFSCHGSTNFEEVLQSGFLLANNEQLTLEDLLQLKHEGGRLATLAACETGIVGTRLPDEVVGLPGAFLRIGFAGVVAPLWLVHDESTAMLMWLFYRLWRKKKFCPLEALQKAQKLMRQLDDFSHPFYWAAFYFTGV